MQKIFFVFITALTLIFPQRSVCAEIPQIIYDFHSLRFIELQMETTTIDMAHALGAEPQDREALQKASAAAVGQLRDLKGRVAGLKLDPELDSVKAKLEELMDQLIGHFEGIEHKSLETIQKEVSDYLAMRTKYYEAFDKVVERHEITPQWSEPFDLGKAVKAMLSDDGDRESYGRAMELYQNKSYDEAYEKFNALHQKNESTHPDADLCLKVRMAECLIKRADGSSSETGDRPAALKLLEEITSGDRYFPILYEAFYQWRHQTQEVHYGVSDVAEIANREYNERRWQVYQVLKKNALENTGDSWALVQIELLWQLPNIGRGETPVRFKQDLSGGNQETANQDRSMNEQRTTFEQQQAVS